MGGAAMRVILVTGANGGIGQAIARLFVDESPENFVWLAVRKNQEQAAKVVAEHPKQSALVHLDVTERAAWDSALRHIQRSEEHTSELQSLRHLVCRLLLAKKK